MANKNVKLKDARTGEYLIPYTGITVPSQVSDLNNDAGYLTAIGWDDVQNKPTEYVPKAHNQGSNSINVLTGYTKDVTGATGALTSGDTLNVALAKLENTLNSKAGTLTGVTMNDENMGTSGVVNLGNVITDERLSDLIEITCNDLDTETAKTLIVQE